MTDAVKDLRRKDRLRRLIPTTLKNSLLKLLKSDIVGGAIRRLYGDQIPHRNGVRVLTRSPRIASWTVGAIYFDLYERSEIDQMITYCDFSLPVVELGASIGVGTLQILKKAQNQVVVVEADPDLHGVLIENIKYNKLDTMSLSVINAMVSYSGETEGNWEPGFNNLTGKKDGEHSSSIKVPCFTLSELLEDHQIGDYNLIVDIEGAEAEMFDLDEKGLARCVRIVAEIDGGSSQEKYYSISDLVEKLKNYGFTVVHEHGNRFTFSR